MDDTFVTVGRFHRLDEANFAKSLLDGAGIHAVLIGDNAVGMAWHLAPALGGVQLQVRREDEEIARAILQPPAGAVSAQQSRSRESARSDAGDDESGNDSDNGSASDMAALDPHQLAEAEAEEEAAGRLTPREELAERAFRAAIIGLVLPPVHVYATWLILRVLLARGRLPLRFWVRIGVAILANVLAWVVCLALVLPLRSAPINIGAGCTELPAGFNN